MGVVRNGREGGEKGGEKEGVEAMGVTDRDAEEGDGNG